MTNRICPVVGGVAVLGGGYRDGSCTAYRCSLAIDTYDVVVIGIESYGETCRACCCQLKGSFTERVRPGGLEVYCLISFEYDKILLRRGSPIFIVAFLIDCHKACRELSLLEPCR